jgi:beta-phosphoglucomutase
MIKGVLFDMDGVLVDSERYICEAAIKMFAERGVKAKEEDFIPFVGAGENKYVGGVAEKYGVKEDIKIIKARTYEIYGQIVKGRLEPLDGVHDFIKKCKAKGLKLAVATSADRIKMEINLREIGLPENTFDATINGLEVERKKPFPDIFISAAKKLGLDAIDCLVVEDAVNGVEAAKAAGAHVLGLTTSFTTKELHKADWTAENLAFAPDESINW